MTNNITDIPLIQDLVIDVTESQLQVAYANQRDNNVSTINCHIQDEGVDLDLSDYKITLYVNKTSGSGYSATIGGSGIEGSVSGNIVSFKISKYMTISPGRQVCDLEFFKNDGSRKFSCTFYLRVGKGALDDQEILDSDYYASVHDEYLEVRKDLDNEIDRATHAESKIQSIIDTNKPNWDDKYTKKEIDDKFSEFQFISDEDIDSLFK